MQLLINQVKDAVDVLRLNREKTAAVAHRADGIKWAIIMLAVPTILNVFLSSLLFPTGLHSIFTSVVFWPIVVPLLAIVGAIFVMSFLAEKFFKGGNGHKQFFVVLAYSSVFMWVTPVAFLLEWLGFNASGLFNLLWLVGIIWIFIVAYNFLVHDRHLAQRDAVLTIIGGVLGYFILQQILGNVLIGSFYSTVRNFSEFF